MASPSQIDVEANNPRDEDLVGEEKKSDVALTVFEASSSSSTSGGSMKEEEKEEQVPETPLELPAKRGTTITRYIFRQLIPPHSPLLRSRFRLIFDD